ncbi:hypothetical protein PFISCL1PPCAC_4064, partial [Pristionchus fissidentatus]
LIRFLHELFLECELLSIILAQPRDGFLIVDLDDAVKPGLEIVLLSLFLSGEKRTRAESSHPRQADLATVSRLVIRERVLSCGAKVAEIDLRLVRRRANVDVPGRHTVDVSDLVKR